MKKNNFVKSLIICSLLCVIGLVTMSVSSKHPCLTCGSGSSTTVTDKDMNIRLDGIPTLPRPSNIRNYPCPATPYLGMGGNPANSLDDSPFSKFYCVVTVTRTSGTGSWGTNGKKTTIWNSTSTTKSIKVPNSGSFRITVDYYEQKNNYWTDTTSSARGKWTSEYSFSSGYSSLYAFGIFTYVQRLF